MSVKVIAHRGASYLAKHENTLEAFKIAIDLKTDMVEFDVRQTKDKELVIYHNDNIDGLLLTNLNYDELNEIAQKSGYRIPTFEEALMYCKDKIKLDIEIKETGFERRAVELVVGKCGYSYDQFQMKSFIDVVVRRIKKYDSNIYTGLLLGVDHGKVADRFNEIFPVRRYLHCKADFISPHYYIANAIFLRRMEHLNIPVYVWTVNKKRDLSKFLESCVEGVITDRPDAALYIRKCIEKDSFPEEHPIVQSGLESIEHYVDKSKKIISGKSI